MSGLEGQDRRANLGRAFTPLVGVPHAEKKHQEKGIALLQG